MKTHLEKSHPEIDLTPPVQDATPAKKVATGKANRGYVNIFSLRTQQERNSMFQTTIPGWVASRNPLDFHSLKAQKYHKTIMEQMIVDLVPFHEVNKPGFLRSYAVLAPNFKVASSKYYRSLLDPTHERIR